MIRALAISLILVLTATAFQSCRKGEDDPFLSLRSRTDRLAGEWVIQDWNEALPNSLGSEVGTWMMSSNGQTIQVEEPRLDTNGTVVNDVFSGSVDAFECTINEDGTLRWVLNWSGNVSTAPNTPAFTREFIGNGTWSFLDGVGDFRNKECVRINFDNWSYRETLDPGFVAYTDQQGGNLSFTWHLDRLADDEIKGNGVVVKSMTGKQPFSEGAGTLDFHLVKK